MSSPAAAPLPPNVPETPPRATEVVTDALLVLMALIWGVNYSVVKYGTTLMAPLAYNGVRIGLAVTVLAVLASRVRQKRLDRRGIATLIVLGMLGNGVYQVLFVEGLARTRAGDAALVVGASPAFMALIGRLAGVERVGGRGYAGIALSMGGVASVVLGGTHGDAKGASVLGDLLVVSGSLCWAVYTILLTRFKHVDGVTLSAYTMFGGFCVVVLAALPSLRTTPWATLPAQAWEAIAYSGVGALVIAYLCWYRGVRVLGPTRTAMYSNLQPVFALAFAWAMLGEAPTVWQGIGAGSIMTGLLLTRT